MDDSIKYEYLYEDTGKAIEWTAQEFSYGEAFGGFY
jgi:hypothetical protein